MKLLFKEYGGTIINILLGLIIIQFILYVAALATFWQRGFYMEVIFKNYGRVILTVFIVVIMFGMLSWPLYSGKTFLELINDKFSYDQSEDYSNMSDEKSLYDQDSGYYNLEKPTVTINESSIGTVNIKTFYPPSKFISINCPSGASVKTIELLSVTDTKGNEYKSETMDSVNWYYKTKMNSSSTQARIYFRYSGLYKLKYRITDSNKRITNVVVFVSVN